ncbi:uncharacterized protein PV09_02034 [Verruconis gallopava]|uniref:Heterokaryon incompatibility domain-containing protein n=1 Tax=Verruconis gallopava TaxID=253628 RepID=A0A0D2AKT2_9PEZI|nr:uncharacterized protein PV09_02034 [Verruconis gallopava]KIW07165.1 hypothetical protein PV09_02034 [Verruconis gallopava]
MEEFLGEMFLQAENGSQSFHKRFVHKPITGRNSIRLIKLESVRKRSLHSNSYNRNVFGIVERSLDDLNLEYVTLSYVRGNQSKDSALVLRGHDGDCIFPVTASLWDAVNIVVPSLVSMHGKSILLWADQVCIDQSNDEEVLEQFKLVGRIYRQCWCCVIWLGPADDDTEAAFTLLRRIEAVMPFNQPITFNTYEARTSTHSQIRQMLIQHYGKDILPSQTDPGWAAFGKLLQREWFSRLWTFQEAVLSFRGNNVVICGRYNAPFVTVMRASILLGLDHSFGVNHSNGRVSLQRISDTRHAVAHQKPTPLAWLLLNNDFYKCSNPADRIYVLLSMQNEVGDGPFEPIAVDLKKPARQLYIETSRNIIRSQNSLRICATATEREFGGQVSDLPSWVTDWSTRAANNAFEYLNPAYAYFSADLRRPHRDVVVSKEILRVQGYIVDTVAELIDIQISDFTSSQTLEDRLRDEILPILKTSFRSHPTGLTLAQESHRIIKTITLDGYTRQTATGDFELPADAWSETTCDHMINQILRLSVRSDLTVTASLEKWLAALAWQSRACINRRFAMLESHSLALVPQATKIGNAVAILHGSTLPYVLELKPVCRMIGVCFVDGLMHGEEGDRDATPIDIY